jgi:MFS family permease
MTGSDSGPDAVVLPFVAAADGSRTVTRDAWRVLRLAVVAQIGFSVIDQGIPTLTGFIKLDLGISAAEAGLLVSSYVAGKILGSYVAGLLADRIGERLILIAGGIVTGLLLGAAMASPLPVMVTMLVVAGMTSAASIPAGGRLVLLVFPPQRRGLALGLRQTGIPIGGLASALVLPWIAHAAGWRWAIAIGGMLTATFVLPLVRSRAGGRIDRGVQEPKGRNPALDRNVQLLTVWGCLLVTGQFALLSFLALDLHHSTGLTLARGSLLVAVAQTAGIIGRVLWGTLSDRVLAYGRKPLLLLLTGVGAAAALLLLAVPRTAPVSIFVGVAFLAGLALIGYQGLWITMVSEAAGPVRVGAALGFASTVVTASVALTPPVLGVVADYTGSYRSIWALVLGLQAAAFVPALLVREPH